MLKKIILFAVVISFYTTAVAQNNVTVSGTVKDKNTQNTIPYASVVLKSKLDNAFVIGTATNEEGLFTIATLKSGNYFLEISTIGYIIYKESIYIGTLSKFIDLKNIELSEDIASLNEIVIDTKKDKISAKMDKKTYSLKDNINQVAVLFYKRCKIYQV